MRGHGLWNQHGEPLVPTVRVVDDVLGGGQDAVGNQYTHRLATLFSVSHSLRAVAELFNEEIAQFDSDFAKTFRLVLSVEFLAAFDRDCPIRTIPQMSCVYDSIVQTLGGRSTPLIFARYPAWCRRVLAGVAGTPVEHGVDDMMGAESKERP